MSGALEYADVSFGYPDSPLALEAVELTVDAGDVVLVAGVRVQARARCCVVPMASCLTRVDAQQANDGWNFSGDPTCTDLDVDATAVAVQALVAAMVGPTDADLVAGLQLLADQQTASGAWQSFGSNDPELDRDRDHGRHRRRIRPDEATC